MNLSHILLSGILSGCSLFTLGAQATSDNKDGTFNNPVIWTDLPDPSVIYVDDTYYMVNTSMFYFPGVTLLESKNLVNWRIASNAVSDFCVDDPRYNLNGKQNAYARGQWATSLSHFKGKFHLLFADLLQFKSFMCESDNPYGPWKVTELPQFYYDSDMLYDETKDQLYVVYGIHQLYIATLNPDTYQQLDNKWIYANDHQEGNRFYHIGDYYYIYSSYDFPASQVCIRSSSLDGSKPWEFKEVFKGDAGWEGRMIHQASLIQVKDGKWWAMAFNDRDGFGRIPFLMPVTFVDGWPMIDPQNQSGFMCYNKPENIICDYTFQASDEFDADSLQVQWQFNHNRSKDYYSFTDRSGWLRLKTAKITDSLYYAQNTLTQRIFGPVSTATAKLDISAMKTGDVAGLSVFAWPYASIAVYKHNQEYKLQYRYFDDVLNETLLTGNTVYLRSVVDALTLRAHFFYSIDNQNFTRFGDEFLIEMNIDKCFAGSRFALFNYATQSLGGYVDIDWFRVDTKNEPYNYYTAYDIIQAEYFDYNSNGILKSTYEQPDYYNQLIRYDSGNSGWLGFRYIDFGEVSPKQITLRYSSNNENAYLQLRKDAIDGEIITTTQLPYNYWISTHTFDIPDNSLRGVQKIYLEILQNNPASAEKTIDIDWFQFIPSANTGISSDISNEDNKLFIIGNKLYYKGTSQSRFFIYAIDGKLKLSGIWDNEGIDISVLNQGLYIIKTNDYTIGKFLKYE